MIDHCKIIFTCKIKSGVENLYFLQDYIRIFKYIQVVIVEIHSSVHSCINEIMFE